MQRKVSIILIFNQVLNDRKKNDSYVKQVLKLESVINEIKFTTKILSTKWYHKVSAEQLTEYNQYSPLTIDSEQKRTPECSFSLRFS